MKFRFTLLLAVSLLFGARLAAAQDFVVYEMKGDTLRGRILKETSSHLTMQAETGERLKVSYHDLRSYSFKGKVYTRRFIGGETVNETGFVTQVVHGKMNLYESNSWAPIRYSSSYSASPGIAGAGSGMIPTGGGKITSFYIDKTGGDRVLHNPVATGVLSQKRMEAVRKLLLEFMGDDELLAYKINNGTNFESKLIKHYVTEYNKRNPLDAAK